MSEHSVAANEVAPFSTEEDPANDGLQRRMSGYGYQSPVPPPPPPPSLVPSGFGANSESGNGALEPSGQGPIGAGPSRARGYQKPSEVWRAASQAWRTRAEAPSSGGEPTPSDVEQVSSEAQDTWKVESFSSAVAETRSELEQTESRLEGAVAEVEHAPTGAGDPSPEDVANSFRSAPTARGFWSRLSASGSPGASVDPAEETAMESAVPEVEAEPAVLDAEPTVLDTEPAVMVTEPTSLDTEPAALDTEPAALDTEPAAPDTEPAAPDTEPAAMDAEPAAMDVEPAVADADDFQPAVDPSGPSVEAMPDADFELDPTPEAEVAGEAQEESETPRYAGFSATESAAPGPGEHFNLARSQNMSTSTHPIVPSTPPNGSASAQPPSVADVRLIVQAVQSAEESAMAYAREIGEAGRLLAETMAHLDRAEAARAALNDHVAGFGPQASQSPFSLD